jgi:hypothetical protein
MKKYSLALIAAACLTGTLTHAELLKDAATSGLSVKTLSTLSFGPDGLLIIADPASASVTAIETGDTGPIESLKQPVRDVTSIIAGGLATEAENIDVIDMAVNPASGKAYLAVRRRPDNASLIMTIDAKGNVEPLDLTSLPHASVTLPGGTKSKVTRITDVAFDGDRIFATGSCNEEFASRIFAIPVPVEHGSTAESFSAETYHVAHRRWETKAPIQSFIPYHAKDGRHVVGAFACTPVAKFRVDNLNSGIQVEGVSMVELGSGNRPIDLFDYTDENGKEWLVVHTLRFKDNSFGPSKLWGARISMDYINLVEEEKTNENAARRDVKNTSGPEGIEIVNELFGATQVAKLGDRDVLLLKDNGGQLDLEVAALP